MTLCKSLFLTAALMATTTSALADTRQNAVTSGWSWGVNIDQLNLDKDAAWYNWVDDKALLIGVSAEHFNSANDFTYTLGVDFVSYDDENGFSQNTNYGRKSSSASGMLIYIEAGNKLRFGNRGENFFNVKVGANSMLGSERSIGNCSNCYSEDINIDGGLYGVVGIGHSFDVFDVALNFKQYFSGDLDNSLGLKFSTTF